MRAQDVAAAPRQPPQAVLPLANSIFEVVDQFDGQGAAAKDQEPRTPIGVAAVEAQAEPNRPA